MLRSALQALLLASLLASPAAAQNVKTVVDSGPAADRVDLVLLADGFRARDEGDFDERVAELVAGLRETPPFDRYLPFLNVHSVFSPAPERGISSPGEEKATLFGTRFVTSGGRAIRGDLAAIQRAALAAPDADRVLVICGDSRHGGSAYGTTSIFTTAFATAGRSFRDVAIHELGHILGNLADEYGADQEFSGGAADADAETLAAIFAPYPNVTPYGGDRARIPWRAWLDEDARVPARWYTSGVSAFEGAACRNEGMFRARRACKMRDNTSPFCEACRQTLILELHRMARPTEIERAPEGEIRVRSVIPAADRDVRTTRAGVELTVVVEDRTAWVRLDDRAPLTTTKTFTVPEGAADPTFDLPPPAAPERSTSGIVGGFDEEH
jgi:hypothetical protein